MLEAEMLSTKQRDQHQSKERQKNPESADAFLGQVML